jgi:hypothetical protein
METKTMNKHVVVTTATVAVPKCANIGWRLDVAPGKTARPSGCKWLRPKCSCATAPLYTPSCKVADLRHGMHGRTVGQRPARIWLAGMQRK